MALGTLTTHSKMLPVQFEVPLANPSPQGLFAATAFAEEAGPTRFLAQEGVDFRVHNYGGGAATGVWGAPWCVSPDDLTDDDVKEGVRPDFPDTFVPMTVWAYDECDLTAPSQDEVRERVKQNLRLTEQISAEREFADRLLTDAGTPDSVADIIAAVGTLEGDIAKTGTLGLIHASASMAAAASNAGLIQRSGGKLLTPLGHQWVFGGGYVEGLEATLVATSPTYGWRDTVAVREATKHERNLFVAVAERSLVIGYEAVLGAAEITP